MINWHNDKFVTVNLGTGDIAISTRVLDSADGPRLVLTFQDIEPQPIGADVSWPADHTGRPLREAMGERGVILAIHSLESLKVFEEALAAMRAEFERHLIGDKLPPA